MRLFVLLLAFLLKGITAYPQLNQIEAVSGFHKSGLSHFSSLPAGLHSGINLQTLAFFQKYHRQQDYFLDEAGLQLSVLKQVTPFLAVGPAFYYNSFAGMMEKLTVSYLKMGANYQLLLAPALGYSNKEKSLFSELYFQIQYRQQLSKRWHLITDLKGLTNWIKVKSDIRMQSHNRSFQYIRLGLSENDNWQFGMAMEFDQYGPDPIEKATPGIFLRKVFIHK